MQPSPPDYATVTRRAPDVEDYIDIVRRHLSWILAPAFAGLVVAVIVAFLWPDTFVSTATIRVVPPQVPQSLVPSNVNSQMSQRINAMYQTISSRNNLQNLITTHNLYPRERQRQPMEDIIEEMKRDIRISPVTSIASRTEGAFPAFQLSYSYSNRFLAQKVVADLVGRFMNENTRERTTQSVLTTAFLKDQVEQARKDLESLESKLASFRSTFQGRLPEELQNNMMQLHALEQRISNLNGQLSRIQQEKMMLESDLRSLNAQKASLASPPEVQNVQQRRQINERLQSVEREIQQLETYVSNLRQQYKDSYPEVRRALALLNTARANREQILKEEEQNTPQTAPATASRKTDPLIEKEGRTIDANIERIQTFLKSKDAEAENTRRDIAAAERQVKVVETRIQAAPASQQQYAELIRDRELAKERYEEMSKKQSMSAVAEDLEKRQQGEMLELLDAASLPIAPTQPKRPIIILAGLGVGLMLGVALAGVREAKDTSLKNLKDVRAYTKLPILGSIPLLENALVIRRRKRLLWLAWSTACLVGIAAMTLAVFYYYVTKV